jgi:PAS domain S-box-containing protein
MDEFFSFPPSHETYRIDDKNIEEKLRACEKQYHSLFSNMMDGFAFCKMIFDEENIPIDFVYLEVNDAFEKITGLKRELVIGRKVTEAIPGIEKANPELFEIYGRVALFCRAERFEVFFKPLSLWLSISVYCPQKGYFSAIFEDITKRKQAHEALQENEKRLNRSQEIAHLGSWELDLIHNQLIWSDEVYRIFGLKPQEFGATYEAFLNAIHPNDRVAVDAAYSGSLREGRDTYEIEHRVVRQHTGEIRVVHEKCEHIRDELDKIVRSVGMVHDITEGKKAEEEVWRAKNDWERTFDSVPDFIAVLDNQYRIVRANRAMAHQLGVAPEKAAGLFCYQCVHGLDNPPDFCPHAQTMNDGKEHVAEVHEPRLGGDFLVSTTPLRDEKGVIVGSVHVARNISERKKIQRKLEENACLLEEYANQMEELANERAKQLNQAERLATIGQTAGMVGHDIRNPLQAIAGELYLAKEELDALPESDSRKNLQESMKCIEENLYYIDKIVADLQDYTKPLKPNNESVNIERVVEEALLIVSIPNNQQVSITIEESLPQFTADYSMLKRVLINLIQNAVQAMPNGGMLKINAQRQGKLASISVEDTGEGIPEEVRDKLFTPLFTTKSKGQGFGLAVVKRLIEAQNGEITFKSQKGKGTTFTIQIPLK